MKSNIESEKAPTNVYVRRKVRMRNDACCTSKSRLEPSSSKTICDSGAVESNEPIIKMVNYFYLNYNEDTGSYDCDGDVDLYEYYYNLNATEQMEFDAAFVRNGKMTIRFGNVKGDFILPGDDGAPYILTSLEGCPEKVGGYFYCGNNQLTSLEGCPETVGGNFYCGYNQLTSLEGCPKSVGCWFDCEGNQLTSLEGCPESVGDGFYCYDNQLTSLKGCPKKVKGNFKCGYNQLTTLEGCPKSVGGWFDCYNNLVEFTEDDVREVCEVKERIFV